MIDLDSLNCPRADSEVGDCNPFNPGMFEQWLHTYLKDVLNLPLGRRLHRKNGGYQCKPEDVGKKYVFAITWIETGYDAENGTVGPFKIVY